MPRQVPVALDIVVLGRGRFDQTTVRDGLTSLRRGFTADSLGGLLREAGLDAPVSRRPGARLVAVWRPAS